MVLQNQCGTWGLCGVAVYWQGSLESWSALAYKQHAAIPQKKLHKIMIGPKVCPMVFIHFMILKVK